MSEILNPKINANSLLDVFAVGIAKSGTEMALAPVIGNGTVQSGVIKLVAGSALHSFIPGKFPGYISSGMVIDGVEDIVKAVLSPTIAGLVAGNTNSGAGVEW